MSTSSRRDFMKTAGGAAAASALTASVIPDVHARGRDEINVALIGCGGRGKGAAQDALQTQSQKGPIKLVALADLFPHRLKQAHDQIKDGFAAQMDVPEERKFVGLDAFKGAMDSLKKGDIAIFATPPAFRWVFLQYAIDKGLNTFLEKPVTVDGPTSKRMLELSKKVDEKNLKVGVGLMVRHCRGRQELKKRIEDGEIGEIIAMRAYRMHGPVGSAFSDPKPANTTELNYQIQRFHSFLWASGGLFSDFYIHQIDECSWMKGSWPVSAHAVGGRHYRGDKVDQNFDSYHVEYTYADGTKFFYDGRTMHGCHNQFFSGVHGSKGSAVVSLAGHTPGKVRTFKDQAMDEKNLIWAYPQPEKNPYHLEWEDLVDAVRNNTPYNEVKRGVEASVVTSMGRMAAHTGRIVTYDEMLNCPHEFAPGLDKLTPDSPAPLQPDKSGKYPIPEPGVKKDREY
ncbi:MAG TPA: Gfo/Idh/MocA family oxidoreductase [Planctomycetota bacterium]|nr:Gfo/Idh/MocA family oxidoreductase [Planctomycetota bacterium]